MKKKIILVVDYGTSNVRVNAVDADNGDIMHSASKKYRIEEKKDGYAEISAEHLWTYSESCMREVAENMGSDEEARAIAFSFFGDNLIPVDREGNALNDCILCTDSRGAKEAEFVNSQIPADRLKEICEITRDEEEYLHHVYAQAGLSARSYHKILRVARTIADLSGERAVNVGHLSEAFCYRSFDKKYWDRR